MDSFIDFKRELDNNNPEAWEKLRLNVGTVLNTWCREKYLEVSWMVMEGKIISEPDFYEFVFRTLRHNYASYKQSIQEYTDLKKIFIGIGEHKLNEGFADFLIKIQQNKELAWKRLDHKLRILIKSWLIKKGDSSDASFQTIYYDSLSTFIENQKKGKLKFADSRKLKSYFLQIAENKRKEYYRSLKTNKFESFDVQKIDLPFEISFTDEEQQKKDKLKQHLLQLNYNEKTIIYGVFYYKMMLKEIATLLDITEESCRVTKMRALRKLQDLYLQVPVND